MPSTYSQNNRLELIASGEQEGLWGDSINDNYAILDRVFGGVGAIALASTTYTLTTDQATVSVGHYEMLIFTGSPSGTATVTISPNTMDKLYFVRNTTTQTIIFTQGSGGNVSIPSASAGIIYCDGAGATAKVSSITDAMTVTSAAITGGSITGLSSMSVSGAVSATSFSGTGAAPAGTIILWSGASTAIPTGWALCNGLNGTPDLRGRFVVGAGTGGSYAPGDTGGQSAITSVPAHTHNYAITSASGGSHTHTVNLTSDGAHAHSGNTNTDPAHSHPILGDNGRGGNVNDSYIGFGSGVTYNLTLASNAGGAHTHNVSLDLNADHTHTVSVPAAGAHSHTFSGTTTSTGSASVSVLPPYYALCYIMKT